MSQIIEKELSYRIGGIFFAIHNSLGRFCREKQYGDALALELKSAGIEFKREFSAPLVDKNSNFIDFLVDGKIVVELKAKNFVTKDDYYQTQRYLRALNLKLGLIVNFRDSHLKPKRVLNSGIYHS